MQFPPSPIESVFRPGYAAAQSQEVAFALGKHAATSGGERGLPRPHFVHLGHANLCGAAVKNARLMSGRPRFKSKRPVNPGQPLEQRCKRGSFVGMSKWVAALQ